MKLGPDSRVLYGDKTATVIQVDGQTAYIRLDTQRPSSDPKPVPLASLTLLSKA